MSWNKKKRAILICLAVFILDVLCGIAGAADRETAFDILDAWTSVRWGEDNIAWIVHYPEELVGPWVRSEAERQRMRTDQAEELRRSFSEELRIGSATAFLLSVHGYGASPVNLAPMADNIVLIDSSGRRIRPIVFERNLDNPISGLVQGFVFFPLQADKNFSVALKGLVPNRETNFTFAGGSRVESSALIATTTILDMSVPIRQDDSSQREVVVRIPTRRTEPADSAMLPEQPEPAAIDMSDFGGYDDIGGDVFPPTEPIFPPEQYPAFPDYFEEPVYDTPRLAPRQVLEIYLRAWIDGDTDRMYSLLSTESQGAISPELFAREVMSGGFRGGLNTGYRINWVEDSARVTVAKKYLFVRTLETRQIDFVMEDGSARVSW